MKIILTPALFLLAFFCFNIQSMEKIVIGSEHTIFCGKNPTVMERYAAETLQKYIALSTGMKLRITDKAASPAIRISIDRNLKPEEHLVKADDSGDLLIRGGFPSGVIYGTIDFLEKVMNCRFLAPDAEHVPRLNQIAFPRDIVLHGEPAFLRRKISFGKGVDVKNFDFHTKQRFSGTIIRTADGRAVYIDPYGYGGKKRNQGHAFHDLSKNFPKDKPEYFSLSPEGKRLRSTSGAGPGQLCLTNPEVRKLFAKNVIQMIKDDDKRTASMPRDIRQPRHYLYSLGRNDNSRDCVCPTCQEALKRWNGNHSGVMMDFISDIAGRVGKDHPNVLFSFLAYMTDEIPVNGYKLPPNVAVVVAQLGGEYITKTNRDSFRSINHPNNADAKKYMMEWRKSTNHLGTWDYWAQFRDLYAAPATNVSAVADNIRFYAGLKLEFLYAQTEITFSSLKSFEDLQLYVAAKMLTDPALNEKELIREFMDLYYGKAAPAMTRYLNYLEKRMLEEKHHLGPTAPGSRAYLDKEFYLQTEKFCTDAEKAAADSPAVLRRIGQERILTDMWILHEHRRFGIPIDVKKVADRLKQNQRVCAKKYTTEKFAEIWIKRADEFIDFCINASPLPEEFTTRKYFDFWGPKFKKYNDISKKVQDSDSPVGSAWMVGPVKPDYHKKTLSFCVYDRIGRKIIQERTIKKEDYPQDEKYHWYKVGKSRLSARTREVFHSSWQLTQCCGSSVFDPLEPNAEYELYVSIKLTGPSYVKGSQKPDGVYLDRLVYLECERKK